MKSMNVIIYKTKDMKKLFFIMALLFVGLTYSSNIDHDVGDKDQTTTMKIEAVKHQDMINKGWEFVVMKIKEQPKGVFFVIKYKKEKTEIVYCSKYIKDFPEKEKPERLRDQFKINVVYHSSGGNPGWRC